MSDLTAEMKLAIARKIADAIQKNCWDFRDELVEEMAEQIAQVARRRDEDGYELARKLDDRCGWCPDASVVEELDGWSMHADNELKAARARNG